MSCLSVSLELHPFIKRKKKKKQYRAQLSMNACETARHLWLWRKYFQWSILMWFGRGELTQHGEIIWHSCLRKVTGGIFKWHVGNMVNNESSGQKKPNPAKYGAAGWQFVHFSILESQIYIVFIFFGVYVCSCHGYLYVKVLLLLSSPPGDQCQPTLTCSAPHLHAGTCTGEADERTQTCTRTPARHPICRELIEMRGSPKHTHTQLLQLFYLWVEKPWTVMLKEWFKAGETMHSTEDHQVCLICGRSMGGEVKWWKSTETLEDRCIVIWSRILHKENILTVWEQSCIY